MTQPANSGSYQQIFRALQLLARNQTAVSAEVQNVAANLGANTFQPAGLVDANGNAIDLNLNDTRLGGPAQYLSDHFAQAFVTAQLRVIPPYPSIQLLGSPGRVVQYLDQPAPTGESLAIYAYGFDVVVIANSDRPEFASIRANALADAYHTLLMRNESLGGLVYLINPITTAIPGGEIETARAGVVSGVMRRYEALALGPVLV